MMIMIMMTMMMMMSVNDIIKKIDRIMIIRGIKSKAVA